MICMTDRSSVVGVTWKFQKSILYLFSSLVFQTAKRLSLCPAKEMLCYLYVQVIILPFLVFSVSIVEIRKFSS